jgi:UDP-N-acetylmuramoyl-tripeptide--D-alanyl-D-alanine ligase
LKGSNFNGNHFAQEAIQKGAKYAIVDEKELANQKTIYYVENALVFLQKLANFHRAKHDIPIIGITGSNGKTTSKELIANVLSQDFQVLYTQGNLNNHIGVPLTLLNLNTSYDIAIVEMGANKPGDIKELVEIADPTHGIITNIGLAHIEGFGSPEGVQKTKKELYDYINLNNGVLFYNADDNVLKKIIPSVETYSYSTHENTTITGKLEKLTPEVNLSWSKKDYHSPTLVTQIVGEYNFYNMLAAIAIGDYFGMSAESINKGITSYKSTNNRSQVVHTEKNTLILDAYNANPTSVKAALSSFSKIEHENKLVILGDMLELGDLTEEAHKEIVELVTKYNLEAIFVGNNYYSLKDIYTNYLFFESTEAAKSFLSLTQPSKNMILLKGSRSIGLEKLADLF